DDLRQLQKTLRRRRTGPCITPRDFAAKRGNRATVLGLVPVGSAKILLHYRPQSVPRRLFGSRSGELLSQRLCRGVARLRDKLVLGSEVPIEAAMSKARGRHHIGKTRRSDSILAECRRRLPDDALPSGRRILFRSPHSAPVLSDQASLLDSLDDS